MLLVPAGLPVRAEKAAEPLAVEEAAEAQAEDASEPDPLAVESERLLATFAKHEAEWHALRARQEGGAPGENARVLEERLTTTEIEGLEILNDLARILLEREARGEDLPELRRFVTDEANETTPVLVERLERLPLQLDALRASRETTGLGELLALEKRVTRAEERLQWVLGVGQEHVVLLEQLGIAKGTERPFLLALLEDRAETIGGGLRVAQREKRDLVEQLARRPDDMGAQAKLDSLAERLSRDARLLSDTADVLDVLGAETAEYRQLLIQSTGEITADVLDRKVASGLIGQALDSAVDWLRQRAPVLLFKVLFFFLIVAAFWLLASLWRLAARVAMGPSRVHSQLLRGTLVTWVGRGIIFAGILTGLAQLGVELGAMLAGLGIAGFIVGFALQDSLANFAAGAMILAYRPFDVGDIIESASVYGTVKDMSLVNTTVLTFDNQTLIVPNSKIWGDVIRNVTAQDVRRVDLRFRIAYGENVERVIALFQEILSNHPAVLDDPESVVKLHELGEWSMDFVVRPWTRRQDYWQVYWDVIAAVQKRLEQEGIRIAVPERQVRVTSDT